MVLTRQRINDKIWYGGGTDVRTSLGPKDTMKKMAAKKKENIFIAQQKYFVRKKHFHQEITWNFASFSSWEQFFLTMYEVDRNDRHFNEIIPADQPSKMYLDIDCEMAQGNAKTIPEVRNIIQDFNKCVTKHLHKLEYTDFDEHIYIWSIASIFPKLSLHLTIDGDICFKTNKDREYFMRRIKHDTDLLEYAEWIDAGVYSSDRNMRILGNSKCGKSNHLQIVEMQGESMVKELSHEEEKMYIKKALITNVDMIRQRVVRVEPEPNTQSSSLQKTDSSTFTSLQDDVSQMITRFITLHLQQESCVMNVHFNQENVCYIVSLNRKFCPKKKDFHRSSTQYIVLSARGLKMKCRSSKCPKDYSYNEIEINHLPQHIQSILKKPQALTKKEIEQLQKEAHASVNKWFPSDYDNMQLVDRKEIQGEVTLHNGDLSGMGHDKKCNGKLQAVHAQDGFHLECNQCEFRLLNKLPILQEFTHLCKFLNVNIYINQQINNYNTQSIENVDILFASVEEIFEDAILNHTISNALRGNADGIARIHHHLGKDLFGVIDRKWWAWKEEKGIWIESTVEVRNFCRNEVGKTLKDTYDYYSAQDSELKESRLKRISKLRAKIEDTQLDLILDHGSDHYATHNPNFALLLDSMTGTLNFDGIVYDFDREIFRKAEVTDYLTKTCGYKIGTNRDEQVQGEIEALIQEIFATKEECLYMMKALAASLYGRNRDETFTIMKGKTGRNGKGLIVELTNRALGKGHVSPCMSYFHDPPATLLTSERPSSSKPNVDVVFFKGKRFVSLSEPEPHRTVNAAFLKFLSGNDQITGHLKHSNAEISFTPQHTLFISCNEMPNMDANDEAMWTRARVIDFPYKFVDCPTEPHHKQKDKTLKEKLEADPKWAENFMLLLLEKYYPIYKKEGLIPSDTMILTSQKTRESNNPYIQFIEEKIISADQKKLENRIKRGVLYAEAEKYIRKNFPEIKFTSKDAEKTIAAKFGKPTSTRGKSDGIEWVGIGYKGLRFIADEE